MSGSSRTEPRRGPDPHRAQPEQERQRRARPQRPAQMGSSGPRRCSPARSAGPRAGAAPGAPGARTGGRRTRSPAPCPPGGGAEGAAASEGSRGRHGRSPRPARFQPRSSACSGKAPLSCRARHRHSRGSPRPQRDLPGAPAGPQPRAGCNRSRSRSGSAGLGRSDRPGAAPPSRGDACPDPCPSPAPVLRLQDPQPTRPGTPRRHRQDPDPNLQARVPFPPQPLERSAGSSPWSKSPHSAPSDISAASRDEHPPHKAERARIRRDLRARAGPAQV
ncbi:translation initiation factor IF-2-like [Vidua macroura]|uniref:translation initiation factor IF-2-like n=1 Tax=Vidua macroura TaxID=187451 RepID=UPI0023A8D1C7|nr:translation initiation factor IF-2-like [Vidua macroura]